MMSLDAGDNVLTFRKRLPKALAPLIALPNWVNWRRVKREDRSGWTKPPFNPNVPTRQASVIEPATWAPYELAAVSDRSLPARTDRPVKLRTHSEEDHTKVVGLRAHDVPDAVLREPIV